jgi:hypothetical protein
MEDNRMRGQFISAAAAIALLASSALPLAAQTPSGAPRLRPAPGLRVDAAYLVGHWSDREDCGQRIEFRGDGRFLNPDGTSGTWQLNGDSLSLTGTRTIVIRLVPRSRNETIVVQSNGSLGYSQRCPPGR